MLAALATVAGQAAVIYKWTDEKGVLHYSDQSVPGAEKIITASPEGTRPSGRTSNQTQATPAPVKPALASLEPTTFAVLSPTPEQTFFGDDAVPVQLALAPGLGPSQNITWHLNGKELVEQGTAAMQFTLQGLDRGAYVIAATLTDAASGESKTTLPVSFFVREPSLLSPLHKRP